MAEDRTTVSSLSPHPSEGVPGCGFALYSLLLLSGFLLGIAGMGLSSMALLQASEKSGPSMLVGGSQVAVWRLQPMRDAGLLELTEVPAAWHDETRTGSGQEACALVDDAVLRVQAPEGWQIPYASIADVTLLEQDSLITVEVHGSQGEVLRCFFRSGEGGDRFARMLRSEAGLPGLY